MTATATTAPPDAPATARHVGSWVAFRALLLRDGYVLRKNLREFLPRTILQPLLLVFVFTYVFPKIGQGIGGTAGAADFSTMLVAGVLASVILFQGIQSVALPMVQEFGFTREIEDRVLAPLPLELVGVEKIVAGALQCLLSALIVFPIATFVPATPVHLRLDWPVLLTIAPLACVMSAALGLLFGTLFDPRTVPLLFGIVVIPLTFLGCIYFPWAQLESIRWLQVLVLVNPLVYMSEGFRAALTPVPHMRLLAVYPVLLGFTVAFSALGLRTFRNRVLS
ncbi:MAG: ABC transporter permease [Acidimicrobiales bacterium]|nr:ABC transporter permease [Acidimicrobiales bacterium]